MAKTVKRGFGYNEDELDYEFGFEDDEPDENQDVEELKLSDFQDTLEVLVDSCGQSKAAWTALAKTMYANEDPHTDDAQDVAEALSSLHSTGRAYQNAVKNKDTFDDTPYTPGDAVESLTMDWYDAAKALQRFVEISDPPISVATQKTNTLVVQAILDNTAQSLNTMLGSLEKFTGEYDVRLDPTVEATMVKLDPREFNEDRATYRKARRAKEVSNKGRTARGDEDSPGPSWD